MEIIKDIVSLIASILIFLGSIIALISAIGIVKFQDVFLKSRLNEKFYIVSITNCSWCTDLFYCEFRFSVSDYYYH